MTFRNNLSNIMIKKILLQGIKKYTFIIYFSYYENYKNNTKIHKKHTKTNKNTNIQN